MTGKRLDRVFRAKNPNKVAMSILGVVLSVLVLFLIDEYVFQKHTLDPSKDIPLAECKKDKAKAHEMYSVWVFQQHQRQFDWHTRSTKIIFWVSMLVAISGISFAFWQFVEASREEKKALETEELELKTKLVSLVFKSRSIAALVMFMSIAYLLIYVILIYPIRYAPHSPFPGGEVKKPISGNMTPAEGSSQGTPDKPGSGPKSKPIGKEIKR